MENINIKTFKIKGFLVLFGLIQVCRINNININKINIKYKYANI